MKDFQATGEAFSPPKWKSSSSKHEIFSLFSFFVGLFCPPGSGFRIGIRIHKPNWIRIQNTGSSRGKMGWKMEQILTKFVVLKSWMLPLAGWRLLCSLNWAFLCILTVQYLKSIHANVQYFFLKSIIIKPLLWHFCKFATAWLLLLLKVAIVIQIEDR